MIAKIPTARYCCCTCQVSLKYLLPPSLLAELLWNEPPSRLSSEELENTAPFGSDFTKANTKHRVRRARKIVRLF